MFGSSPRPRALLLFLALMLTASGLWACASPAPQTPRPPTAPNPTQLPGFVPTQPPAPAPTATSAATQRATQPNCGSWFVTPPPLSALNECAGASFANDAIWQPFDGGEVIAVLNGPTVHWRVFLYGSSPGGPVTDEGTYVIIAPEDGTLGWMQDEVTATLPLIDIPVPPEGRQPPAPLILPVWVGEFGDPGFSLVEELGWPTAGPTESIMEQQFVEGEPVSYLRFRGNHLLRIEQQGGAFVWQITR